ncbi:MAG: DUF1631 family protein [Gammaproteobacteria bacterium]|nr:DUF1631 family protein [Gammaproteobacteria bacterium]
MTLRCQAALRMLRERARQFMASGMAACVACANDNLFELTKAAPDADAQTQYLDAMRLWHGARCGVADALLGCVDSAFTALGERSAVAPDAAQGLVSDEELEEIIAIDSMAAAATEPMREVLGRLLGRVEALCGATLTPREFPLTPHFMLTIWHGKSAVWGWRRRRGWRSCTPAMKPSRGPCPVSSRRRMRCSMSWA